METQLLEGGGGGSIRSVMLFELWMYMFCNSLLAQTC
jgi:hypothetical protein